MMLVGVVRFRELRRSKRQMAIEGKIVTFHHASEHVNRSAVAFCVALLTTSVLCVLFNLCCLQAGEMRHLWLMAVYPVVPGGGNNAAAAEGSRGRCRSTIVGSCAIYCR